MTQADLGVKIGSDRLYVSQLERGIHKPSLDLLQIAAALGISVGLVMPKSTKKRT